MFVAAHSHLNVMLVVPFLNWERYAQIQRGELEHYTFT